jgi:hypothetical protein
MAKLAFILLAHEAPDIVIDAVEALVEADETCTVVIHYDRRSPPPAFQQLQIRYRDMGRVLLIDDRVACGWGEFGLVEATVNSLGALRQRDVDYSHAYLVSASCFPIRPLGTLRDFLDQNCEIDFIESQDESWIGGGLRDERYRYYFPFSFTRQRNLFELATAAQRRLNIHRKRPDLAPRYGSQWWCLRRRTVERVLDWIDAHTSDFRFFRQVWIPDETFFQTIVPIVDGANPSGDWIPTLVSFNAFGKPVVFYDDHKDWLSQQPFFFARKIAPTARHLRRDLARRHEEEAKPVGPVGFSLVGKGIPRLQVGKGYGRIFDPASAIRNWKKNLSVINQPFVVLYGPPQLTGLATRLLTNKSGLQTFGRLFDPHAGDKLSQSKREASRFRDYDRALHLACLLSRSEGLPVFELCPGDDTRLEKALQEKTTALVVSLAAGGSGEPSGPGDKWRAGQRGLHGEAFAPFLAALDELTAAFAVHDWRVVAPGFTETGDLGV